MAMGGGRGGGGGGGGGSELALSSGLDFSERTLSAGGGGGVASIMVVNIINSTWSA